MEIKLNLDDEDTDKLEKAFNHFVWTITQHEGLHAENSEKFANILFSQALHEYALKNNLD